MNESRSFYKAHLYSPDMTIIIKEMKFDDNKPKDIKYEDNKRNEI